MSHVPWPLHLYVGSVPLGPHSTPRMHRWPRTQRAHEAHPSNAYELLVHAAHCVAPEVVALVLGSFDSNNRRELAPAFHSFAGKRPQWLKG